MIILFLLKVWKSIVKSSSKQNGQHAMFLLCGYDARGALDTSFSRLEGVFVSGILFSYFEAKKRR